MRWAHWLLHQGVQQRPSPDSKPSFETNQILARGYTPAASHQIGQSLQMDLIREPGRTAGERVQTLLGKHPLHSLMSIVPQSKCGLRPGVKNTQLNELIDQ